MAWLTMNSYASQSLECKITQTQMLCLYVMAGSVIKQQGEHSVAPKLGQE